MNLKEILPKLAELLKLKTEQVETAMVERKVPYCRLALIKLVADKGTGDLDKLLESSDPDTLKALQTAQASLDDALERLDSLYCDVALIRLDRHAPVRSVAKRK